MSDKNNQIIEFRVTKHPSGNYTLMRKMPNESMASDVKGKTFTNSDADSFYLAVGQHIAEAIGTNKGDCRIVYEDLTRTSGN